MSRLDKSVLEAIEKRNLSPRPPVYFLARRSMIWTLACASILLGAVCVAVGIFAVTDFMNTGGRNFDEMPFDDLAESLPVVWAGLFALFVFSAYIGLSRTRRGYLYRPLSVIGFTIVATVALGLLLHAIDAGRVTHRFLVSNFASYKILTTIPYAEWSRPDEGYLGGAALSVNGSTLRLRDFGGREWDVDISTATTEIDGSLVEEGDIAIRGTRTGPLSFKARSIAEFD